MWGKIHSVSFIVIFWALLAALIGLTGCEISSKQYILEEASNPAFMTLVSRADMISALAEGDLISVGETHELGQERDLVAQLYKDLAPALAAQGRKPEVCAVETYHNLIGFSGRATDDPVREAFHAICPMEKVFDNPKNDYRKPLEASLRPGTGLAITHTGHRHTMPIGALYPKDYGSLNIGYMNERTDPGLDQSLKGTIALQVPSGFREKGGKSRSHATIGMDHLLLNVFGVELKNGTDPAVIEARLAKIDMKALAGDYEIKRVSKVAPYHRAFVTLFDNGLLTIENLRKLAASEELREFLATTKKPLLVRYVRGDSGGTMGAVGRETVEGKGSVFVLGADRKLKGRFNLISINRDGEIRLKTGLDP